MWGLRGGISSAQSMFLNPIYLIHVSIEFEIRDAQKTWPPRNLYLLCRAELDENHCEQINGNRLLGYCGYQYQKLFSSLSTATQSPANSSSTTSQQPSNSFSTGNFNMGFQNYESQNPKTA